MKINFNKKLQQQSYTACLYAASGSGKTFSLSTIDPSDLIYFDLEGGDNTLVDLYNQEYWDFSAAEIFHCENSEEFFRDFQESLKIKRKFLAIDSVTKLSSIMIEEEKLKNRNGMQAYLFAQQRMTAAINMICKRAGYNILLAWEDKLDGSKYHNLEYSNMPKLDCGTSYQLGFPGFLDYIFHLVIDQQDENKIRYFCTQTNSGFFAKARTTLLPEFFPADWTEFFRTINNKG